MVMGIRGQESMIRQRAVSVKKEENYLIHFTDGTLNKGNVWKIYPIYDWQTEDVWTAPNLFGWDYNHAYDVMEANGLSHAQQRCSPAYGEEPMQGFYRFKSCFPEVWDKMSMRVPGANTAFLYARSELYGFGDFARKPDNVTWEEHILHYVQKFSLHEQSLVAKNVRTVIREHYGKTSDPILVEIDHPVSGISWKRILNIAMRGDFKRRRTKNMITHAAQGGQRDEEKAWQQYNEARMQEGL